MPYFYIFLCKDNTFYCGSAMSLENREAAHNSGKGSKYVKAHGGGKIIYSEKFKKWGRALSREAEVKKWKKIKKLELVKNVGKAKKL
jgi:putative endonuclease